jgi:hypothetical protein
MQLGLLKIMKNKPNRELTAFDRDVEQFKTLFSAGCASFREAGLLLVRMLDAREDAFEVLLAQCPGLTLSLLQTMEDIGRGRRSVEWMLCETYAGDKIAKLPGTLQAKLLTGSVKLPVMCDGVRTGTKTKPAKELTRFEADLVIDTKNGRLRTVEEAEKILVERHSKPPLRYKIDGDKVTFFERCTFTAAEFEPIYLQLKAASTRTIQSKLQLNQVVQARA